MRYSLLGVLERIHFTTLCVVTFVSLCLYSAITVYAKSENKGEALRMECMRLTDSFEYGKLKNVVAELVEVGRKEESDRLMAYGYVNLGGALLVAGDDFL